MDRAKSGLKKNVAPEVERPKPPEKKINPMDLIREQIRQRLKYLKMHENEKDDSGESSEEDD